LSALGKKVLVVDLDPQGNLSQSIGINADIMQNTVYQLLREIATFDEVVYENKKFDVIPANIGLSAAELELAGIAGREFLLKEGLDQIEKDKYDFILIDCSPSLGVLTLNALVASKEVFIPVQTQYLSMQGISQLIKTIEMVKDRLNKNIKVSGVILTMYDSRKNLNKEVCQKVIEYFDKLVFKTKIGDSVSLAEAPSHGMDIFDYKIASKGALNYLALAKEIIKQKNKND
jgi:chromosome partitioning protein